jgi:Ca-activated chloride channel family protein
MRRSAWVWGSWAAVALFGVLGLYVLIAPEEESLRVDRQLAKADSRTPGAVEAMPGLPGEAPQEDFAVRGGEETGAVFRFDDANRALDALEQPESRERAVAAAPAGAEARRQSKPEQFEFDGKDRDSGVKTGEASESVASTGPQAGVASPQDRIPADEEMFRSEWGEAEASGLSGLPESEMAETEMAEAGATADVTAGAAGDTAGDAIDDAVQGNEAPEPARALADAPGLPLAQSSASEAGRRESALASASSSELRRLESIAPSPRPAPMPAPTPAPWASLPNDAELDAMYFQSYGVNPFIDTEEDPQSTFAVDVDTASYTIVRGYLDRGIQPPPEAVRVEEFVNYFKAPYPPPTSQTFAVYSEVARSPFREGYTLLKIGIKGREIAASDRKPVVLTFVVDVSGSMAREDRLGLVKRTLGMLLFELRPGDRVGLAVFGSEGREILPHVDVADEGAIERGIARLVPGGSTNAEEGLRIGYAMARRAFDPEAVNRVILCSDGVANIGRTGADSILDVIGREANDRIYLTSVGFGLGNTNDVLLEQLADRGNGHYAYLDSDAEALEFVRRRLAGSMEVIAQDVKVQVEFGPERVRKYRLLGYENRDVADRDFRNDRVDAGEIGAWHAVTALYELKLEEEGARGELGVVRLRFKDPARGLSVREIEGRLDGQPFSERFADAEGHFRLVWIAAQFAEVLRGSYWAREYRIADLIRLLEASPMNRALTGEREELLRLMRIAERVMPEAVTEPYPVDETDPGADAGEAPAASMRGAGQLEMIETPAAR